MKLSKLIAVNLLLLPILLNQSSANAEEKNELASVVLEPLIYKSADSTLIENIVTKQLSNPLYSTGYGISIRNLTDGSVVFESNADDSMMPASLTKIYTAASNSLTLDLDAKFVTKVKFLDNNVYLVGGGDPQLGTESNPRKADLEDLAKQTAENLKKFNVFEVNLFVDDSSLGPLQRPVDWLDNYFRSSEVHLISALNLDDPLAPSQAPEDPSITTGQTFAVYLIKNDIKVNGLVYRKKAPSDAFDVATEYSKSVAQIIEDMLIISNNQDSEILARVASDIATKDPSTNAATELVLKDVEKLGISSVDNALSDTSGLSRSNKISPSDFTNLIYKSVLKPDLIIENKGDPTKFLTIPSFSIPVDTWPVFTGLPTGHGLGTMEKRFNEENSPGRGVVRAKTGTLNQVITLAGTITTKDNAFLSFAILVNRVEKPNMVREELDNLLNEIAKCECAVVNE
jgi:D-alanyl-D-alanine carboxypeptidase/D-alanyl-D-alanine-endopeptidase (penicillin-binding protein 4)